MGVMNKLMDLLGPKPLGDGMAQKAADKLSGRGYQIYKAEAEANGGEVLSPEAWAKSQR